MAERESGDWSGLIGQLRQVADTISATISQNPLWTPDSVAAVDVLSESKFSLLPYDRPINEMLLTPPMLLHQALDHLIAFIAVVEEPDTILALFTLLRPLTVACSRSAEVSDVRVATEERLRRAMNIRLESDGEMMNFLGREAPEFETYRSRREKTVKAWKQMGHTAFLPSPKATADQFGLAYLGIKPTKETYSLKILFQETDGAMGATLYRLLSATTHAQIHAIYSLMVRERAVRSGDEISTVPIGMSGAMMLMLALTAVMAFRTAIERGSQLYGWSVLRWNTLVEPMLRDWLTAVNNSPEGQAFSTG